MKKISMFIALILVFTLLLGGCGQTAKPADDGRISIVCTVFPVYDWIYKIIGENSESFDVTCLTSGGDLHSFQPSMQDIAKIHLSDLFVYVGGESDKWVDETVKDRKLNAIRLFDVNKDALLCADHDHDHGEAESYDEHIWLSLDMAQRSVKAIAEALGTIDPENSRKYTVNGEKYCQKLAELDAEYANAAEKSGDKTIVFADRFPFLYMTERYGIECIAAFPGCSADQDASFEVIARLADAVDRLEKETILVLENSNQTVAETVIKNTEKRSAKAAVMNSCQSVTEEDADYIEIMTQNLEALKEALN